MGLINRVKTWIDKEEIEANDLNAEFDNILNNITPQNLEDFSASVAQLQTLFDLGDIGLENLPENLSEELGGLRSMVKKITGEAQFYVPPQSSIASLVTLIGTNLRKNRIKSGLADADGQPQFLRADDATLNLVLEADPTNLVSSIGNQEFTASADDALAVQNGFAAANTATYNGGFITNQTITLGEAEGSFIQISAPGAEFGNNANRLMGFKTVNGPDTEYFIGIFDGNNTIVNARRGFFFDSTQSAGRVVLAPAQTIEILRLSWIFIKKDGTLAFNASGNEPITSATTPGAPVLGDYWFDTINEQWKINDGSSFIDAAATLCGFSVQESGKCVATRSMDFNNGLENVCNIKLNLKSVTEVEAYGFGGLVHVYGQTVDLDTSRLLWDITTDRDTGVVETADTRYFLYLTNLLLPKISDVAPYDREEDLKGWYHPHKPWRCIGTTHNDGSSDLDLVTGIGSEPVVSDHSIGTKKLRPYLFGSSGDFSDISNFVARADVVIGVGGGQSNSARILCTGRPVIIMLVGGKNAAGDTISFNGTFTIEAQRASPGGAFVALGQKHGIGSTAVVEIPASLMFLDNPGPGHFQYRIDFQPVVATTGSIDCFMIVFEM